MMTAHTKILVTGGGGQLARCLRDVSVDSSLTVTLLPHRALDITEAGDIRNALENDAFQYCINCAAYTKVDLAEEEQEKAWNVNADGPALLAGACRRYDIPLIHISTDYVYHNDLRRPLLEGDPVLPASVYARSKLSGEQRALAAHPQTVILRSSWLYSEYGGNFVKTIIALAKKDEPLRIVSDQTGAPTYCRDLARAILQVIHTLEEGAEHYGVYNCANGGQTTWFGFARMILDLTDNEEVEAIPVPTEAYPTAAARPPYSVLDMGKLHRDFGIALRPWNDALVACLQRMQS